MVSTSPGSELWVFAGTLITIGVICAPARYSKFEHWLGIIMLITGLSLGTYLIWPKDARPKVKERIATQKT